MKYERADSFKADYRRLSEVEQGLFKDAVRLINETARGHQGGGPIRWPARLRMQRVQGTATIWEMTWSFSGPDGRATFEFIRMAGGEEGIRWRRVGGHGILEKP